jgi:hypothetical protein
MHKSAKHNHLSSSSQEQHIARLPRHLEVMVAALSVMFILLFRTKSSNVTADIALRLDEIVL